MATIGATITIDFQAFYAGDHRACFRIFGSGDPYDCTTVVNCVGSGAGCQVVINTTVNSTSCDGTVTFEGYIQPTCQDILSTEGRLVWTADFVPNVVCQRNEIECVKAPIASVTVTNGGQEYDITDTLNIVRDGADTETSDGTISINTLGPGNINSISSLLAAGTGYVALEVLTIVDGGGAGSGGTIRIDTVGGGGDILTFTLLSVGMDYVGPFTFTGGSGAGADFDIVDGVDYDIFGKILTVNVDVAGSYGVIPTVTITTVTGSLAVLTVVLADCAAYNPIANDCASVAVVLASGLAVGETFATCLEATAAAPPSDEYVVTEVGCCIPEDTDADDTCIDYHLDNNSGGVVNVQITNCEGTNEILAVADATDVHVCLVNGGIVDPQVAGFTIDNTGNPCEV